MNPVNFNNLNADILALVFRNSEPNTLSSCSSVCQEWNKLITANIWREVIHNRFALGVKEYKTYFNHDVKNIELPVNIYKEIMSMCSFSVANKVNKAPILALIDPNLNLKKIGELVKPHLLGSYDGFADIPPELLIENRGNTSNEKPYWVLLMNGVIYLDRDNKNKGYIEKKALIEKTKTDELTNYRVPTIEEIVLSLYLERVALKKASKNIRTPFTCASTYTQNTLVGNQFYVGWFTPDGLSIQSRRNQYDDSRIDITALRKF